MPVLGLVISIYFFAINFLIKAFFLFVQVLPYLWTVASFIFLWRPLAWVHCKLWNADVNNYWVRKFYGLIRLSSFVIIFWYVSYYPVVYWSQNQTLRWVSAELVPQSNIKIFRIQRSFLKGLQKKVNTLVKIPLYHLTAGPLAFGLFWFYRLLYGKLSSRGTTRAYLGDVKYDEKRHAKYLKATERAGRNYIGYNKKPFYLELADRKHIDCMGTTQIGKSTYVLLPLFLQDVKLGLPVIFVDAKGSLDNAEAVYRIVKFSGREKDFRFFSLTLLENSDTYNPLISGNMVQICDKIISSMDWSAAQPYFKDLCQRALLAVLTDFESAGVELTFANLLRALENPPEKFSNIHSFMGNRENWKNTEHLRSEFSLITKSPFGFLLDTMRPDIDLKQVYDKNLIAYFSLDAQSYPNQAARVGKMVTSDINTVCGMIESKMRRNEKHPLSIFVDEFSVFGTEHFGHALAMGGSAGLCITIAHQSVGDLRKIGEHFAQRVNDLTSTKIILKLNDDETIEQFCKSLGTEEAEELTEQVQIEGLPDASGRRFGTKKKIERYKIHPTAIKELDTGEAVVKSRTSYGKISLCPWWVGLPAGDVKLPKKRAL